ncbi:E3 ubiquitin-protein ligase MARCHF8-like [Dermacentor variabilis]|uniref:E3 ubiquitin-protein ligase MARCHF8-like n=1 Tax=Dermacentor variabilis TaxID=34621 RepID=UPI003F5B1720
MDELFDRYINTKQPLMLPPDANEPCKQQQRSSSLSSNGQMDCNGDMCRICHNEMDPFNPLISPCHCAVSLRYVHQDCLQQWIMTSATRRCELCKFDLIMDTKVKPFRKWKKLELSSVEKSNILCNVMVTVIVLSAMSALVYVLYEISEDIREGTPDWSYRSNLIVTTLGSVMVLGFIYIQCKMFVHLFRHWRAFKRIIYIHDAPVLDKGDALPTVTGLSTSVMIQDTICSKRPPSTNTCAPLHNDPREITVAKDSSSDIPDGLTSPASPVEHCSTRSERPPDAVWQTAAAAAGKSKEEQSEQRQGGGWCVQREKTDNPACGHRPSYGPTASDVGSSSVMFPRSACALVPAASGPRKRQNQIGVAVI